MALKLPVQYCLQVVLVVRSKVEVVIEVSRSQGSPLPLGRETVQPQQGTQFRQVVRDTLLHHKRRCTLIQCGA
jgi:hypothetical protein